MTDLENTDVSIVGMVPEISPNCPHTSSFLVSVCTSSPLGDSSGDSFPLGGFPLRVVAVDRRESTGEEKGLQVAVLRNSFAVILAMIGACTQHWLYSDAVLSLFTLLLPSSPRR